MATVVRMRPEGQKAGGLVVAVEECGALMAELGGAPVGESYTVTVEEMSREELDNLPEFDGF